MAKKLYADKANSIKDICNTLHLSRATLYRYLKAESGDDSKTPASPVCLSPRFSRGSIGFQSVFGRG